MKNINPMGDKEETSILNKLFETKTHTKKQFEIDKNEFIKQ